MTTALPAIRITDTPVRSRSRVQAALRLEPTGSRSRPLRILYLAPWYPYPPDNGIRIRLYQLVRALGARHAVTLLAFTREDDVVTPGNLKFLDQVKTVLWKSPKTDFWGAATGLFSKIPRAAADSYNPEMVRLIAETNPPEPYDVVIASTVDTAAYAALAPATVRLLEEHNFMTRWMEETFRREHNPLLRTRRWLTFVKCREYETQLYSRFDACTMVSEADARGVRALLLNPPPVHVIPNCVDLEYYHFADSAPQPHTLVFNGSLTYSANLDAMRYFLSEIWQRVKQEYPAATLAITGKTGDLNAYDLPSQKDVHLTGYVADIRPTVGSSWACIVPLRDGGGTRLKILEAMALGTPVVSTSKGAEGLEVSHGENILIADDPGEFARLTAKLLREPELRARLAANARKLVEAQYDWRVSTARFEELLQDLVEEKRAR